MNYSEMSDFEINKAVAVVLGGKATTDNMGVAIYDMGDNPPLVVSQCMHSKGDFLPCISWADAGPIIHNNLITITPLTSGKSWQAFCRAGEIEFRDKKPLRAAMIVFLMMQESK